MADLNKQGRSARQAARRLAAATRSEKDEVLLALSRNIVKAERDILAANAKDLEAAKANGMSASMQDRLLLDHARLESIAQGVRDVAALPDPIGEVDRMWKPENGLTIGKERVPLGVIGIIFESRPNVTVDAAVLCFKSGNAVILKGGSDAYRSNSALIQVIQATLQTYGFPGEAIQLADASRETAQEMMRLNGLIDVLIPRGGANLIRTVVENATVPVIETGSGNCHIYVDKEADIDMAVSIVVSAKCSRPSVCNACETVVVHEAVAAEFLPKMEALMQEKQVELRADKAARHYLKTAVAATTEDYAAEFSDLILAVKTVDSLDEAIEHINLYSTGHSESIITRDYFTGRIFHREIDSAAVYINASTRFTDGFEFGFGAEIGISTQKLHARGPMGLAELTSTKYIIFGEGQTK